MSLTKDEILVQVIIPEGLDLDLLRKEQLAEGIIAYLEQEMVRSKPIKVHVLFAEVGPLYKLEE